MLRDQTELISDEAIRIQHYLHVSVFSPLFSFKKRASFLPSIQLSLWSVWLCHICPYFLSGCVIFVHIICLAESYLSTYLINDTIFGK
jgi:hypothetical protein